MIQLSICMMVKNEEKNLYRCLNSLESLRGSVSNELVIIDTGSTDSTIEIAKQYTDKVYEHEWNNDFGDMRNKSISYAKGKWLFIIDADEELVDGQSIVNFINMKPNHFVGATLELDNVVDSQGKIGSHITSVRLFKNDGKFRYEGKVHNLPVIKGEVKVLESKLLHYGYMVDDTELMDLKFERTAKLLKEELAVNPENIYYRFQLATTYNMHRDMDLAKEEYEKAYEAIRINNLDFYDYLYLLGPLAKIYLYFRDYSNAIKIALEGIAINGEYIDLYYFLGLSYLSIGEYNDAIKSLNQYMEMLKDIDSNQLCKNPALQMYTLDAEDECHFNLMQVYNKVKKWDNVKVHSEWLLSNVEEGSTFFVHAISNYVNACINLKDFDALVNLYQQYAREKWYRIDEMVFKSIDELSTDGNQSESVLRNVAALPSLIGQIYHHRLEGYSEIKRALDYNEMRALEYLIKKTCGEALIFALNYKLDISSIFIQMSEMEIMEVISSAHEKNDDFYHEIESALKHLEEKSGIPNLSTKRILAKYLMLRSFGKSNQFEQMDRYISFGLSYLIFKYNSDFLCELVMKEFQNSEEQLLVIIWNMLNNPIADSTVLINQACAIFPEWSKAILEWVDRKLCPHDEQATGELASDEFNQLKEDLYKNIDYLIENQMFEDAAYIISEFSKLYGMDEQMHIKYDEALKKRRH